MDTFIQCATQMLREFRALLCHSPIVFTTQRLVQLMALNMFSIENTQSKGMCQSYYIPKYSVGGYLNFKRK